MIIGKILPLVINIKYHTVDVFSILRGNKIGKNAKKGYNN